MSDESKEKRKHEEHHAHHANPHKHGHARPDEDAGIHPGWFLILGAILLIVIVIGWTLNYGF